MRECLIDAGRVLIRSNITASLRFLADAPRCRQQAIAGSLNTLRRAEIEVCDGDLRGARFDLSLRCGRDAVDARIKRALAQISGTQVPCGLGYALPGLAVAIAGRKVQARKRYTCASCGGQVASPIAFEERRRG